MQPPKIGASDAIKWQRTYNVVFSAVPHNLSLYLLVSKDHFSNKILLLASSFPLFTHESRNEDDFVPNIRY